MLQMSIMRLFACRCTATDICHPIACGDYGSDFARFYEVNNKAFRYDKWAAPCHRDGSETHQTNGKSELLVHDI